MAISTDTTIASAIPRRSFLRQMGSIPLAGAVVAVSVVAARASTSSAVHELWNERRSLRAPYRALDADIEAAKLSMPWWAQSGPPHLRHDGTFSGGIVGWPAKQGVTPPEYAGSFRNIRPGKHDLRRDYEFILGLGPKAEARALENYQRQLRALALRLREQKSERERVRLPELDARQEALGDRIYELNSAIDDVVDHSPDALAAKLMLGIMWTADTRDPAGVNIQGIESALIALRPHLTGNIAADAADLMDNPDGAMADRPSWV